MAKRVDRRHVENVSSTYAVGCMAGIIYLKLLIVDVDVSFAAHLYRNRAPLYSHELRLTAK